MTIRIGRRDAIKPKAHLAACGNCPEEANCPHSNHYTPSNSCVNLLHGCNGFKARETRKEEAKIRKDNRRKFFGSTHERLAITDVEISIARGQSDVIGIERQVPFKLGVQGMVYIADALATLKPGGAFTHRIYEPKGKRSLIYLLKRRIMELMYPKIEFFEVIQ